MVGSSWSIDKSKVHVLWQGQVLAWGPDGTVSSPKSASQPTTSQLSRSHLWTNWNSNTTCLLMKWQTGSDNFQHWWQVPLSHDWNLPRFNHSLPCTPVETGYWNPMSSSVESFAHPPQTHSFFHTNIGRSKLWSGNLSDSLWNFLLMGVVGFCRWCMQMHPKRISPEAKVTHTHTHTHTPFPNSSLCRFYIWAPLSIISTLGLLAAFFEYPLTLKLVHYISFVLALSSSSSSSSSSISTWYVHTILSF